MADGELIINLKRRLALGEKALRLQLAVFKKLLPSLSNLVLTPNSSFNTTFDGPLTPLDASTSGRRDERAQGHPFYLSQQLSSLETAYNSFDQTVDSLLENLDMDHDLYGKVLVKSDHYGTAFLETKEAAEDRIWFICATQRVPLPGERPEEVQRYQRLNNNKPVVVGLEGKRFGKNT